MKWAPLDGGGLRGRAGGGASPALSPRSHCDGF